MGVLSLMLFDFSRKITARQWATLFYPIGIPKEMGESTTFKRWKRNENSEPLKSPSDVFLFLFLVCRR